MAIYNEILAARYSQLIFKLFSMKSPATKQVGGEIMPVIEVDNLPSELRLLANYRRWGIGVQLAASAANINLLQIRNPTGSNVLATMEKMTLGNAAAAEQSFFVVHKAFTTDQSGTQTPVPMDGRQAAGSSVCIVTSAQITSNPVGSSFWISAMAPNVSFDVILFEHQEITIAPGFAVQMFSGAVNVTSQFSIMWRERHTEPSELIGVS
jgi:hypothetical protein